jgi:hypothetical protein
VINHFSFEHDEVYLVGVSIKELMEKYEVFLSDLMLFTTKTRGFGKKLVIEAICYYLRWAPQEVYYYAVENTGFKAVDRIELHF